MESNGKEQEVMEKSSASGENASKSLENCYTEQIDPSWAMIQGTDQGVSKWKWRDFESKTGK